MIDQKTVFQEFARIGGSSGRGACKKRNNAKEASETASRWRTVDADNRKQYGKNPDCKGYNITTSRGTFFCWHVSEKKALSQVNGRKIAVIDTDDFTPRGNPRIGCWQVIEGGFKRIA
jgi:hypothetical protein